MISERVRRGATLLRDRLHARRERRILPDDEMDRILAEAAAVQPLRSQKNVLLHLLGDLDDVADVPGDVLEIGSFKGKTTVFLSHAIEALDLEKRLYTVDPYTDEASEVGCSDENIDSAYETFHRATADLDNHEHIRAYSDEALSRFEDPTFSLVFVDGDHTYEGVMTDYRNYAPLLADGGIMVFDDYANPQWPGVGRAVETIVDEGDLTVDRRMWKTVHLRN